MTNYSLRARMMILILAPTVLIGLLLSIFFVVHRYNDLQRQLEDAGASIIEPLAVSTEYGMSLAKSRIYRSVNKRTASSPFRYCSRDFGL